MEITARGKTLTLRINGASRCTFESWGQPTGLVGLGGESDRIEFRNLMVKELSAKSDDATRSQASLLPAHFASGTSFLASAQAAAVSSERGFTITLR